MKGTVITRNSGKSWVFVIDVGRDENGKRLRKWSKGYPKKKDAQAAMRAELHRIESGGDPYPVDMTLGAYLEKWLDHQSTRLRESTHVRYRTLLSTPEVQKLANLKLQAIRPAHCQSVMDELSKRYAARTIGQTRAALSSAFKTAIAWGLVLHNPAQAVKPPKPERSERPVPSPAQLKALIAAAKGTPWEIAVLLSATTGARRSEVLGLRWRDLDLANSRIRITQGLHRMARSNELVFLEPKTSRSKRAIALPPFVVARLRSYRQEQNQRRLALGPDWTDLDLVVDRGDGRPFNPSSYSEAFTKRLAPKVGLPPKAGVHSMRHAVATMLMHSGTHPAVVSAMLGHSSPAFTLAVYSHVSADQTDAAADAVGAALGI